MFEDEPATQIWGVKVGRAWVKSWDAERRVGTLGPERLAFRWWDFAAVMNVAAYLGGRAVEMDKSETPSLFG